MKKPFKLKSSHIKQAIFNKYRFDLGFVVGSEVVNLDGGISDILMYKYEPNKKEYTIIDIEIKTSISDLKNEVINKSEMVEGKKSQHKWRKHETFKQHDGVTNYFYFAIPSHIYNKALPIIKKLNSGYGIMTLSEISYLRKDWKKLHVKKRVNRLNNQPEFDTVTRQLHVINQRVSSELTGLYNKKMEQMNDSD